MTAFLEGIQKNLQETPTPKLTEEQAAKIIEVLQNPKKEKNRVDFMLDRAAPAPNPKDWKGGPIFKENTGGQKPSGPWFWRLAGMIAKNRGRETPQEDEYEIVPKELLGEVLAPAGGTTLVEEIVANYERDKAKLPFTVPYKETLEAPMKVVITPFPQLSGAHWDGEYEVAVLPTSQKESYPSLGWREYNGYGNRTPPAYNPDTLLHEIRHGVQLGFKGQDRIEELQTRREETRLAGTGTYFTDKSPELKQAIGSFVTGLRAATGRKMTDPLEIRQAIHEMERDPKILERFRDEPLRIFRAYQTLKKENPKTGEKLLNAICNYGPYLVQASPNLLPDPKDLLAMQQPTRSTKRRQEKTLGPEIA